MTFTTIILHILLLSFPIKEYSIKSNNKDSVEIKLRNSLFSKQNQDTIKLSHSNFNILIRGTKNYDIVLTKVQKDDYEEAKQIEKNLILDKTQMPSQVNFNEKCYTVSTSVKTINNCLANDEQLLSISYLGFIKKLNTCVITENWFESTITNLLINLEDGSTSYISGDELIFSPDLKFIYSYANDGIDFDGISLYEMKNKKIQPIFISDYNLQEKYKFDFSALGKVYWDSNTSFLARKDNEYYKFKVQDKRITYRNEIKKNMIHSENKKFIIKVDQLNDGSIRYSSWNKPNTINDRPSLILYNGEKKGESKYGSSFDYSFENGEYLYTIENNTENTNEKRLMLKLYKNNEEILYTSLTDIE